MLLNANSSPSNVGGVVPLWIGGRTIASVSDTAARFPIIHEQSKKVVHEAVSASPAHALEAVETSAAAFDSWSQTSITHRQRVIMKAADLLEKRADELTRLQVLETSCSERMTRMNIHDASRTVREIAVASSEIRGTVLQPQLDKNENPQGGLDIVIHQPVGTVLIIPPWNGAVILPSRGLASALVAGCSVVLKGSEKCPATHQAVVEIFEEAGVPRGVISNIQVKREDAAAVTEAIIGHPAVRKVEFIGSAAVGKRIAQMCGKYLKPIIMELGNKSPALVLDDADLELAATECARGGKSFRKLREERSDRPNPGTRGIGETKEAKEAKEPAMTGKTEETGETGATVETEETEETAEARGAL